MEENRVIALVGMPGSGKSTCVEYIEHKGLPSVYLGGITIDEVKARGLEVNETNEKMVREDIRAKEGIGAYAKRIIPKIQAHFDQGHKRVIADGLYGWTEYKIFKENFGDNVIVIAIVAPRADRHARLGKRPVRPLSEDEANARDYAEIENLEKGGPIANADFTIVNDGTPEQMLAKLEQILQQTALI